MKTLLFEHEKTKDRFKVTLTADTVKAEYQEAGKPAGEWKPFFFQKVAEGIRKNPNES